MVFIPHGRSTRISDEADFLLSCGLLQKSANNLLRLWSGLKVKRCCGYCVHNKREDIPETNDRKLRETQRQASPMCHPLFFYLRCLHSRRVTPAAKKNNSLDEFALHVRRSDHTTHTRGQSLACQQLPGYIHRQALSHTAHHTNLVDELIS